MNVTVATQGAGTACVRISPGADDGLVKVAPILGRYGAFASFLAAPGDNDVAAWIAMLAARSGHRLARQRRSKSIQGRAGDAVHP
jgi:hypothetical protein